MRRTLRGGPGPVLRRGVRAPRGGRASAAVAAPRTHAAAEAGYAPGGRASHSMLFILPKHRRFDDARALLDEMRRASTTSTAVVLLLIPVPLRCAGRSWCRHRVSQ
ncbi:hypothetical protein PVAP13_5NG556686 [Panicum virgatum]|uniref:Uncharacterized protein n=1 Tax=Panicum virgatum TaxID=38727 RepID=A0A8T0S2S6_PANVG|nr:hypothetical protein PVAP13_5NG556686 [Panicum virgatum]